MYTLLILALWDVTPTWSCILKLIHTHWALKLPSLCTYHSLIPQSHHASLQSTYHRNYRILLQYITYITHLEPQSRYIISIENFYLTLIKHMCKLLFTISNTAVTSATPDHTLHILAPTSLLHPSNQTCILCRLSLQIRQKIISRHNTLRMCVSARDSCVSIYIAKV